MKKTSWAIIIGASKGIGLETAKILAKRGMRLTLISRGKQDLDKAAEICKKVSRDPSIIESYPADAINFDEIKKCLSPSLEKWGAPNYLINVVGYAHPNYIQDLTPDIFKKNMEVNYLGQIIPTLVVLPYMRSAKAGQIAFVSSMAGFLGIMGYASYTPTKFAIVGLAEGLRHELKPWNIKISILYPPDTQTPGFDKENEIKPKECAMISEGASLLSAEKVAMKFIKGLIHKRFRILPGETFWIYHLNRLIPRLVRSFIDSDYRKALKKTGNLPTKNT